jgi:hypothetical protein
MFANSWKDDPQREGGCTMMVEAPVSSKPRTFSCALEIPGDGPRLPQFRQPPKHTKTDVASCPHWGLNRTAVEPQASLEVDWSWPAWVTRSHRLRSQSAFLLSPLMTFPRTLQAVIVLRGSFDRSSMSNGYIRVVATGLGRSFHAMKLRAG